MAARKLGFETLPNVLELPRKLVKLRNSGFKLLEAGAKSHARHKKLRKIVFPYQERTDLSWLHKSILYEEHRKHDPAPIIRQELGDLTATDAIYPMLLQQGATLLVTEDMAQEGMFEDAFAYAEVMEKFVDPLLELVDTRVPINWKTAVDQPWISFMQPYVNTVGLGMTQHIAHDFRLAFTKQLKDPTVVQPEDWVNSWAIVKGVTRKTAPLFGEMSGRNTWSVTGPGLDFRVGNAVVKSTRDIPYIDYALSKEIDIDSFMVGGGYKPRILMRDPEEDIMAWVDERVRRSHVEEQIRDYLRRFRMD